MVWWDREINFSRVINLSKFHVNLLDRLKRRGKSVGRCLFFSSARKRWPRICLFRLLDGALASAIEHKYRQCRHLRASERLPIDANGRQPPGIFLAGSELL